MSTSNYMMTSTTSSTYDIPMPTYEDPDALKVPQPPMTNYLMTSTYKSSYETPQPIYEDLDALVPAATDGGQSEVKVNHLPHPSTEVQKQCNNSSGNNSTTNVATTQNNECSPDPKRPHPVRPPPRPPMSKLMASSKPSAASENLNTSSINQPSVKVPQPPTPNYLMTSTTTSSYETTPPIYEDLDALLPVYVELDASVPAATDGGQSEVKVNHLPHPSTEVQKQCNNGSGNNSTTNVATTQNNECSPDPKRPHPVRPPPRPPMSKLMASSKPSAASENLNTSSINQPSVKPPAVSTERTQNHPPRPERPPPPSIYYGRPASTAATQSKSNSEESQQPTYLPTSSKLYPALPEEAENLNGTYVETVRDSSYKPVVPPRPRHSLPPSYASVYASSPTQYKPPPPPPFNPPPPPSAEYTEIEDRTYLEILTSRDTTKQGRSTLRSENKQQSTGDTEQINGMLKWLKMVSKPGYMTPVSAYGLSKGEEIGLFNHRAMNLSKAMHLFNLLMMKRNESLRCIIAEFITISDSLDKLQKKSKTMGIAGGTAGAVGGVSVVMGIALAPMTMGASLIATAVGAGMVASAGGMGAHNAITRKKIVNRMTIEKLVSEYQINITDLEHCLEFILSEMNELRRHDIVRMQRAGALPEAVRMAHLSQSLFTNINNNTKTSVAPTGGMPSEKLLLAFSREMDLYFTENDGQKLKKFNKSKFSGRVRLLAENLQDELEHLNHMWEMFT